MNDNNTRKVIGNRINGLLAEQDKTQKALAGELGVKPNVISYFCKGERTPNTEQLVKIAHFFNVSADYLLGLTDNKTIDVSLRAVCDYIGLQETSVHILKLYKEMFKNKIMFKETQDWLISNHFLSIVFTLVDLATYSNKVAKSGSINEILNQTGKSQMDIFNEVDDIKEANLKCDVKRYELVRIVEKMANVFDQRKEEDIRRWQFNLN